MLDVQSGVGSVNAVGGVMKYIVGVSELGSPGLILALAWFRSRRPCLGLGCLRLLEVSLRLEPLWGLVRLVALGSAAAVPSGCALVQKMPEI